MIYLVFDTSANGMPKKWNAPHTDTFNWPPLIHIAWHLYDEKFKIIAGANDIVKPENFEISEAASRLNGIINEQAITEGIPIVDALNKFKDAIDRADYLFAFNMKFNQNIVAAEFFRNRIEHRLFSIEKYCLMEESTYYCKIPGKDGRYKWPTLQQLHMRIFGQEYSDPNRANRDLEAVARCLTVLIKKDIIDIF